MLSHSLDTALYTRLWIRITNETVPFGAYLKWSWINKNTQRKENGIQKKKKSFIGFKSGECHWKLMSFTFLYWYMRCVHTIHWEMVLDCGWKCSSLSHYSHVFDAIASATAGERLLLCVWMRICPLSSQVAHTSGKSTTSRFTVWQLVVSNSTTENSHNQIKKAKT